MKKNKPTSLKWKVHTKNLLTEIVQCSGHQIYKMPINILGKLLAAVGERAAELNDPILNSLMCRLAIYTISDPESSDYNPDAVKKIESRLNKYERMYL